MEVILVVFFSRIKCRGHCDFRNHRPIPFPRLADLIFHAPGCPALFFAVIKYRRTILGGRRVDLAVKRGGIVDAEEVVEQFFVT